MQIPERRCHRVYGRTFTSALPIPELPEVPCSDARFDVVVAANGLTPPIEWSDIVVRPNGREWIATAEDDVAVWFRCRGCVLFRTRAAGPEPVEIVVAPPTNFPPETVRHTLLDGVLPALIARSGAVVLHGAAAVLHGGAIVVLGESGVGKSTLATVFALAGDPVLSDDCIVIDAVGDSFLVQPSYPSLRLWQSSAEYLLGSEVESRPFTHDTHKRRYDTGLAFAVDAAPLRGILRIDARPGVVGGIEIEAIRGHAAGDAVVSNVKYAPRGSARLRALQRLFDFAGRVPVARLSVPADFEQLLAVREAVIEWSARL